MKNIVLSLLLILGGLIVKAQNINLQYFGGVVLNEDKTPLQFANVTIVEAGINAYTDISGRFSIRINLKGDETLTVRITSIGKRPLNVIINRKNINNNNRFTLLDNSLQLNEVEIVAKQKTAQSNSSVVFDRETIENAQAFSLADIMMGLPGKTLSAPQLQNPQQLTLRGEATGNHILSNSLGIGIIVDGVAMTNDANMQNLNVGNRAGGMSGSIVRNTTYGSFDVPFGGLDLREIPADNIESIEVISGVAPAQYGDITDGAVIINRQAGKTDYQVSSRINSASSNFSLTKGYKLNGTAGALNVSLNYLYSAADPRDMINSLNRLSGSLMWTKHFGKKFKNTIGLDGNERLDKVKQDPDDRQRFKTASTNRNFSFTERALLQLNGKFFRKLDFNAGLNYGYQNSYTERFLNQGVVPATYKDTTGVIYEGSFLNIYYTAIEQVIGKPLSIRASSSATGVANTGNILHAISFGASYSFSDNLGAGQIADPTRPRWYNGDSGEGNSNDRPYDYSKLVPAAVNFGFYANDRFKVKLLNRTLSVNAGVRYDIQNGFGNIQPRINTTYNVAKNWQMSLAYGIATKAPTLAHRYPAPTYFDVPLIAQTSTGGVVDVRKALYLVYTEKYIPDNSNLKPSRSNQIEAGLKYSKDGFSSSIFAYHKTNRDGFGTVSTYRQYLLPEYDTEYDSNGKIVYYPSGNDILKINLSLNSIINSLKSSNSGIEWFVNLPQIKPVRTTFNLVSSFTRSDFQNSLRRINPATANDIANGGIAWYGIYAPLKYINWTAKTKLNSTTHIPKLGFYVNFNLDVSWDTRIKNAASYNIPIAYIDQYDVEHPITTNIDPNSKELGYLVLNDTDASEGKQPFVFANLSMQVAKEIKKRIRFSLNAYNVLNTRARYYNPLTESVTYYNNTISVGAQLSVKF